MEAQDSEYFDNLSNEIEEKLDTLARTALALGLNYLSTSSYTSTMCALSAEELQVKLSLNRMKYSEEEILNHLASAIHEEYLITKWTKEFEDELERADITATLERQKAALVSKAREYQKELEKVMAQMPETPSVTVSDILGQRDRIRIKEQEARTKRAKIRAFKGLPPNLDVARHELRNARQEQMKLIQLRERLLGAMAAGVS